MDKIKLVIWDLDETFWHGTLSEEGVVPIESNIEIVKELSKRGIVNSIVSKNNFEDAKLKLQELGVWDYFIFPKICWEGKGPLVKQILKEAGLRSINTLFLDDNHFNIEEVKFFNPEIFAYFPDFIEKILSHHAFKGKDDRLYSRLNQYKILEKKVSAAERYDTSLDFLKASEIKIAIFDFQSKYLERTLELINRTNQLNFTKKRISKEQLKSISKDSNYICKLIRVKDKFGDYGIVGFYALNTEVHSLEHFLFSCRIINIGIEDYVFHMLNSPKLVIIPDVVSDLSKKNISWIEEVSNWEDESLKGNNNIRVLVKGGCDLMQMTHYLKAAEISLLTEFNYMGENNIPIHTEHTELLKLIYNQDHMFMKLLESYPFFDENSFKTQVFLSEYDILIYSVLMDYTQNIYCNNNNNSIFPWGGYYNYFEQKNEDIEKYFSSRNIKNVTSKFIEDFKENYNSMGQLSTNRFEENLLWLLEKINKPIIFINGAEIDNPITNIYEKNSKIRHTEMNSILDKICQENKNVYLLDMRKIVTEEDITDNIRHYKRKVYEKMSQGIISIINDIIGDDLNINSVAIYKERLKNICKGIYKKLKK